MSSGSKSKLIFRGNSFDGDVIFYQAKEFKKRILTAMPDQEIRIEVTIHQTPKTLPQLGYYFGAVIPTYQALLKEFGDLCNSDEARWKLEKQSPILEEINIRKWNKKKILGELNVLKAKKKISQEVLEACGDIEPFEDDGALVFNSSDTDVLDALIRAGGVYMEYEDSVGFKPYREKTIKRVSALKKMEMSEHIGWCVNQITLWSDGFFVVETPEEYYKV